MRSGDGDRGGGDSVGGSVNPGSDSVGGVGGVRCGGDCACSRPS